MSRNRHKSKNTSNHPKPIKKLIDAKSPYSPNSIGGRIDLQALRDKLFCEELNETNQTNHTNHTNQAQPQTIKLTLSPLPLSLPPFLFLSRGLYRFFQDRDLVWRGANNLDLNQCRHGHALCLVGRALSRSVTALP